MLCDVCQSLDLAELLCVSNLDGRLLKHQAEFVQLAVSASNGCELCMRIMTVILQDRVDLLDSSGQMIKRYNTVQDPQLPLDWMQLRIIIKIRTWHHRANVHFSIMCGKIDAGIIEPKYRFGDFRIYIRRSEQELEDGLTGDYRQFLGKELSGREIAAQADSETVFRLANLWLDQCTGTRDITQRHRSCQLSQTDTNISFYQDTSGYRRCQGDLQMPSRTLNLGPSDGSQSPFLAVHTPESFSSRTEPWAALSHRWGSSQPLKTTADTIDKFRSGIAMDELTQTFRDAVHLTRRLGIRHLWIDSLCIMQDSREDWAQESQRMGEIYRGALINISPTVGRSGGDGFLDVRRNTDHDTKITLESTKYGSSSLFLGSTQGIWATSITADPPNALQGDRLHSRVWVLQEVMLSPRTIHFTSSQLLWEYCHNVCMESCAEPTLTMSDEEGTSSSTLFMDSSMKRFLLSPSPSIVARYEEKLRHTKITYPRWYHIVFEYTRRRLTFDSDILPAIGGIAKIVHLLLNENYLAGIFEGDLIRGLLWVGIPFRENQKPVQSHPYNAPSWSWAAHGDGVHSHSILASHGLSDLPARNDPCPMFIEAEVQARYSSAETSDQVFGALSNGHLTLRTYSRRVERQDLLFYPTDKFGETSALLDNGRHESFDSIKGDYGEIELIYKGSFHQYIHALMAIPSHGIENAFVRVGVFVRDKSWFFDKQSEWVWQEIKIV